MNPLQQSVALLRTIAFSHIAKKHSDLAYHRLWHTMAVLRRTNMITKAMGLSPEERICARGPDVCHDVEQIWSFVNTSLGPMRYRKSGVSEGASAQFMVDNWPAHQILLSDELFKACLDAVFATTPQRDESLGTIIQPRLTHDSHPIVRAVALADINGAAIDGPREAIRGARTAYREKYPGAYETRNRDHMLAWLESQVTFIRGRDARLEVELGNLQGKARDRVAALFCHGDESAKEIECLLKQFHKKDPYGLDLYQWYSGNP